MPDSTSVMWFRRDLRINDNPALAAAARDGSVLALFVFDPALLAPAGAPRVGYLRRSLRALRADIERQGGRLAVRCGRPEHVVPRVVQEIGARAVHIAHDFAPYGTERDQRVERELGDIPLVRTGSPYAIPPDRMVSAAGAPFQVFTPYYRAWLDRGWLDPAPARAIEWEAPPDAGAIRDDPAMEALSVPDAGEAAAKRAWDRFRAHALAGYDRRRDRSDLQATSRMSVHLKFGEIHPRTLLADIAGLPGSEAFRRQIAWRDFYAAVLHAWPGTARKYFHPQLTTMPYDTGPDAERLVEAWKAGRTGYPIVDAGMRQLLGEGWMHNRVRMIVASFLVKDLHQEWTVGARHFMKHLVDGDLASNQHGWQWIAGTGTDPAPYFRISNPITQGRKVDPLGDYVRRWVPELRGIAGPAVHEPWTLPGGIPAGYPAPIVDHDVERAESLARYRATTGRGGNP